MRLGTFGSKAPGNRAVGTPLFERIAGRALAAQAKDSAEGRKTAKRSGEAARAALNRQIEEREAHLAAALDAVALFDPATQTLLADELDAADPITQHSAVGRASTPDAGLPGWLRDRAIGHAAYPEGVVRDWLVFRDVFAAHREFSARPADDPLPQLHEAMSLFRGESIAVEGVATAGLAACTRIVHVALALRATQRAGAARDIRSLSGYAAADAWRAFDRSNRFMTAELAEWIAEREPGDAEIAAAIADGRFSTGEFSAEGRSTGISPSAIDEAGLTAALGRGGR